MDPRETEQKRETLKLIQTILQEVRIIKQYVLEIKKSQSQRIKQIEKKNI